MLKLFKNIGIVCVLFMSIVLGSAQTDIAEGNKPYKEIIYKVIDSTSLKLRVYYPDGFKKRKKYPTMVFYFGGGWNGGNINQFKDQALYFSSRGMITVLVDYRVKNKHKTTPFDAVRDAKSAMRYLRGHAKDLHIDKNKIVAAGGSAGGHLAAATTMLDGLNEATDDLSISSKACALVLYNPVIDNSKKGYGYDRIGTRYLEISPLHNIKKGTPPTIFFLGSKDKLIPVSTAASFKEKMQVVGSRCDVFIYDGQPHGFFNKGKQDADRCYKETTHEADLFLISLGILKGTPTICMSKNDSIDLYVSKGTETKHDGTKEFPFGDLAVALDRATEIKSIEPAQEITIHLLPGAYYLSKPIEINTSLNGITIKGTNASEVSIKGSVPMEVDWEKYNKEIYVTNVDKDLNFDQFVINGKAQILARYPNYNEEGQYWQGYAADVISKERIASWKNPEGTYFHALHGGRWGGFHYQITGVHKDGTPILKGGHQNNRGSKPHKEYRMVENVFEELDSPGEWFFNKAENKLYYWPSKNLDLINSKVEVSVLKGLIQIIGTLENPVKNIRISGITFENTKRTFMEEFEPLLRSDWTIYRGSALFFEGTEDCVVSNNVFTNLGGNVIMASKYNKGLKITGNHIHECGASAISFIGDPSAVRSPSFNYGQFVALADMDTIAGPKNELYPRECLVEDNLIYRIGRIEKQSAGVQISMSMDITINHNSIYDVPRAGINIGDGTWGGHILENNDVFNTVLETSDHGSFNSWGRDRFWHPKRHIMDSITTANPEMPKWDAIKTPIIRNNRFRCDHGWDIDLDDGSSNYHIYNNLLLNSGLKLREGFYRVVENNIMVNNSLHPHVWFANSEDVFKNNIVQKTYQDVGLLGWGKDLDYNLFPNEESMMKPQMYDRDLHSAFGDPLFKDPKNMDFSVLKKSPALAIGFVNFPMDQFGVLKPELKALAKTPEVPVVIDASKTNDKAESYTVAWLRNTLKSVESEQEQSAYGLNSAEGVVVLTTWKHSPAVKNNGIKRGDVIIKAKGENLKNLKDFFRVLKNNNTLDVIDIVVMRNQAQLPITIRFK